MKITFSLAAALPGGAETAVAVDGDVIAVDGVAYDLSEVPEGGKWTPEGEHPFVGDIRRRDGVIICSVRAQYDAGTADPDQRLPAEVVQYAGEVSLPVSRQLAGGGETSVEATGEESV